MKLQAVILMLAILLGIMAPPALTFAAAHDTKAAIGTLDICSHAAPAVSTGGEMPCMHTTPCNYAPVQFVLLIMSDNPVFSPFNIPSDNEHPPR